MYGASLHILWLLWIVVPDFNATYEALRNMCLPLIMYNSVPILSYIIRPEHDDVSCYLLWKVLFLQLIMIYISHCIFTDTSSYLFDLMFYYWQCIICGGLCNICLFPTLSCLLTSPCCDVSNTIVVLVYSKEYVFPFFLIVYGIKRRSVICRNSLSGIISSFVSCECKYKPT